MCSPQSTERSLEGRVGSRWVRGGWLCDEVGMGKTACVTALMLANSATSAAASSAVKGAAVGGRPWTDKDLKVTLVVVNNSLVQQVAHLDRISILSHDSAPVVDRRHPDSTLLGGLSPDAAPRPAPCCQWEDEVKKFAPAARVYSLYNGAGEGRTAALTNLTQVRPRFHQSYRWPCAFTNDREHATKPLARTDEATGSTDEATGSTDEATGTHGRSH